MSFDDYKNPILGKTYISPALSSFGRGTNRVRIASKVIDQEESFAFGTIKDEIVLRRTSGGKTEIRAKFIEEQGGLFLLSLQGFTPATDKPHNSSFSFIGEEIPKLMEFIENILGYGFDSRGSVNISDEELKRLTISQNQAARLFTDNEEVFAEVLSHQITKSDVVALGYRKRQLEVFERLLTDPEYFSNLASLKDKTPEGLWQEFFEKNRWIFGYGLSFLFVSDLDERKLEQVVDGFSVKGPGKRVDALLRTKGLVSSLCFVEIKTHATSLLKKQAYRSGCWSPSSELAGGVSQVQGTVEAAVANISTKLELKDDGGNPLGEHAYSFQPRSFLVIGSLSEFAGEHGVNEEKFRSFELLRRNTQNPEIITFDELYERSKFIVYAYGS